MKETFVKSTLKYALLLAGLTSLPAMAHIGYGGRDFGTFTGAPASSTITNQSITGNYGWIDGTDSDWGDSHSVRAYRFTLTSDADVKISFQEQAFVTSAGASISAGILPGFSIYKGLAHLAPFGADFDSTPGSIAIRDAVGGVGLTEGSFRSLTNWSITNTANDPASVFTYVGSAYDGSPVDYGTGAIPGADGLTDHSVSGVFHLTAGDYSIFVGGSDYADQLAATHLAYGLAGTVALVPEPETYAMLLAGLGLIGFSASRRRKL
ncbi:MAG: FxDxF family PEP-CTERM protein [Nitrosomonas sp.]|nr:PEP-CTERM sorting domain-containing protein [Nitrosomonas sp.]MCG7755515.1 FxDxF family PEP-CTERM protein [Nitrosomonas sp.]UJP00388.1 MAG: FxDxF family PEP-CTERM protein [Nitrosomonas sp.]UJP07832.1 MAG: FxDxF family PEP-CTERM protein [Nitrosomonas sp.]